jgi:hypothetical protein
MSDPDRVARIRAYLEQHRDSYDREALRQQLLADGHDPQAIDLAMAQVFGLQVGPQPNATAERDASFNTTQFALIIIGIVALNFLLLCGAFSATVNLISDGTDFTILLAASTLLPLLIEGGAAWALRRRNRTVSRGLMWGAIASGVLLLLGVLLIGACFALLSGGFGG